MPGHIKVSNKFLTLTPNPNPNTYPNLTNHVPPHSEAATLPLLFVFAMKAGMRRLMQYTQSSSVNACNLLSYRINVLSTTYH